MVRVDSAEAINARRAKIIAGACGAKEREVHRWQRDSGLSWDDFWLLANEINLANMSDEERASVERAVAASVELARRIELEAIQIKRARWN